MQATLKNSEELKQQLWSINRYWDYKYMHGIKAKSLRFADISNSHESLYNHISGLVKSSYLENGGFDSLALIGNLKRFIWLTKPEKNSFYFMEMMKIERVLNLDRNRFINIYSGPQVGTTLQNFLALATLLLSNKIDSAHFLVDHHYSNLLKEYNIPGLEIEIYSDRKASKAVVCPWFKDELNIFSNIQIVNKYCDVNVRKMIQQSAERVFEKLNIRRFQI